MSDSISPGRPRTRTEGFRRPEPQAPEPTQEAHSVAGSLPLDVIHTAPGAARVGCGQVALFGRKNAKRAMGVLEGREHNMLHSRCVPAPLGNSAHRS